jgi:hypothetical protein
VLVANKQPKSLGRVRLQYCSFGGFCINSRTLEAMERVKQNLRRRIQDSHEHAKVVAIILGILGFFNALFHNHSSKATSTFWRFLITFVVNLVPKTDYVCVLPSL